MLWTVKKYEKVWFFMLCPHKVLVYSKASHGVPITCRLYSGDSLDVASCQFSF